jgi:hypothetical protein
MKYKPRVRVEGRKVFVAWFRHWRTGQRVYPRTAKAFCFTLK